MKQLEQTINRGIGLKLISVDEENRSIDFEITNEARDSYGTHFLMDGWDLERYRQNPVVTYNHYDHSNDPDDVIGISEIRIENNRMIARLFFEDNEPDGDRNLKADKLYRKAKKGTIRGASIAAMIYDARLGEEDRGENPDDIYFTRQELVAWSVVTVPSNPEALSRSFKQVDEIRSGLVKDITVNPDPVNNKLSRCDAQLLINQNEVEL